MPVIHLRVPREAVHKSRRKGGGYTIVEKRTGRVKGHSRTKRKARISASIRNRAITRKRKR